MRKRLDANCFRKWLLAGREEQASVGSTYTAIGCAVAEWLRASGCGVVAVGYDAVIFWARRVKAPPWVGRFERDLELVDPGVARRVSMREAVATLDRVTRRRNPVAIPRGKRKLKLMMR